MTTSTPTLADVVRCTLGFHDWVFGGLPPMWRKCRRCGVKR